MTTCRLDELLSPETVGVLTVSETALADSARVGSTALRTTVVQLGVSGAGTRLGFTVTAELGSAWITQGLGAGNAPNDLTIAFSPAGLAVGEYRDTLRIVNDGPDPRPLRVPVQFTILPCSVTELGALPAQRSDDLTSADCASTSQTDRFSKRYRLTAATNDSLTVRVTAPGFTPRLTLRREGAMTPLVLAESCEAAGSGACSGYVRIPEDGTYEIEVTSANAGATGSLTLAVAPPRAPELPATLAQRSATDPNVGIAAGATINADRLAKLATLLDADLDSLRLEVEVRPVGTPFTDVATAQSPFGRGPTFAQTVTGLVDNLTYRWQARAVDQTGRSSAWVAFNGGADAFSVDIPEPPTVPTALVQRRSDNVTSIPLGGTTNEPLIRLGATISDPDPNDQVRLELEVRPVGTAFTNIATQSSAPQTPGTALTVSVAGLQDNVQYRWQARAVDQTGRTSPWVAFGGAGTHFRTAFPPSGLAFVTEPSSVAAGSAITPAVRVAVQDAIGNTLQSFTGNVTVALASNGNGATLGGTRTVAAVAGIATFTDLSVDRVGSGYTLTATAGTLSRTSAPFSVTSSAAQGMTVGAMPSSVVAGATIAPAVTVTVRDALGNVATGFSGIVSLALAANAEEASLLGTTAVAAVDGVATFDDLRVERAAAGLTLVASATGLANASSTPFAVVAGAPSALRILTPPSAAGQSGAPLAQQPVLQVEDAFANPVRVAGTAVAASIESGPGGGSLTGSSASTDAAGRAAFTALALVGASGNYTLTFEAGTLRSDPTPSISIGAGAATQLAIVTPPPATAVNGAVFTTAAVVRLRDAAGNAVAQADVAITASIASGGGSLLGSSTVLTNAAGEATFSDLGILGSVGPRTIAFSAAGLSGVASGAITLSAGAATTLALAAGDGQSAAAATAVSVPPAVVARDVSGNPVAGVEVSFAVASGGGSIEPSTPVVTGSSGVAALTSWTLGPLAGANTLTASAGDLDGSPVTFTATAAAGAASQLTRSGGDNLSGPVGTTLATPHEVRVTDATGNPVAGVTITWTPQGGGTVSNETSVTDADGRATTTRTLGPTAGAQSTLAAATLAGGSTSVSFAITATVGGATQLTLLSGDAQVDTVGATLPQPLRVLVRDALNNPVQGVLVSWTVLAGGGSTTPTSSLTNASGIAETSWRLGTTRTATDSTQIVRASGVGSPVTFIALARAGAVSAGLTTVTLSPGSITASTGTPATVTVTARDGFNNPVAGVPVTLSASGSGNTIVQPVAVTNASGVATGSIGATVTGARTVTATAGGVTASMTPTLTVTAAAPAALVFVETPGAAVAAADLTPAPAVGVLDAFGNRNFTFAGTITLELAANPAGGTLSGTLTRTASAGVATFPGVSINRAGAGYTLRAVNGNLSAALTAPFAVSAGTLDVNRSSITVEPSSIVAGSGLATVTVTARDANDNPIAGLPVVLSATGSGNTLTQPDAVTDANGVATGTLSATITGARSIGATIDGAALPTTASVTVTAGAVSPTLSTITGIPSTLVAGVETSNVTVTARDALGNAVPGATVVIAATGAGNTVTQPSGPTNASGVAVGGFVSTVAELKTLSATINGVALASTATVTVNPGAVSAARSLLTALPDSLVAGEGTSVVTVTARDANDNLIPGASVTLAATGAGNTLTQPTAPTDASGLTTGSLRSTAIGPKVVSATINGIAITATDTVRVFAGGISAAQSSILVEETSFSAGDSTAVTVTVRDASGNPIGGVNVELALSGSGNTLRQPLGVTGPDGIATASISSTRAEAKTLSATANGIALLQAPAITVTPAAIDAQASGVVIAPTTVAADGSAASITITLRDAFQNPVPNVSVTLAATGSGNTLVQPSAATDASGSTSGSISSTIAGDKRVSATAAGTALADTVTLTVTPAAVSATQSTVSVAPTSLTAGSTTATITVIGRDANGNVVPGAAVTLAATGTGNTLGQPGGVTDAAGVATGTISSTGAGSKTITATIAGTSVTQTATLTVAPAAFSPGTSTVAVSAGTISAGVGSTTVTVTVQDAFGNPIPGVTVVIAATGTGNAITPESAVTNAAGVATGTFTSTVSEAKTISATADGAAITQTATVNVVPDAASAVTSLVQASATTLVAGADTATITVTARDANGNPVPGVSVTLEGSATDLRLVQPAGVTDADGRSTGRVSGTIVGARSVTALLNGVPAEQTVALSITPAAASGDSSRLVIVPSSLVAGAAAVDATVTARDAFGNVVPGATVVLSASPGDVVVTQPASVTDASGIATGRVTATLVGPKVVSATVNGVAVAQTDTITVTPAAVSATTTTVSAAPTTIVAGGAASTITVTARDQFTNLIPGASVVLSVSGDENRTLTQPSGSTNASGVVTGSLAATTVGARVVSATVNGTAITQTASVTVTPAAPSATASTIGADPATIVAGGAATTITVQVRDQFNNPIPGVTVALTASGSGNTLTQPAVTDATGRATGTLASTVAEEKSVQATAGGVTLASGLSITVAPGAVSAATSTVAVAPASIAASGGSVTSTVTVTARDANGNLIPNATVVIAASGDGNFLTQPGETGANGVATGAVSSTAAGSKTISATINGTPITQTAALTVTPAAISGGTSTLSLSASSITAGGAATTATVTVRDQFGNPVPGVTVTLAAPGTSIGQPSGTTNASGVTTGTIASVTSGLFTVSATAGGVGVTQTQQLTVTPGAVSASLSTIEAGTSSIVAGSGTSAITVTARDANGNLIPNATVALAATGSANVFAPAATGQTDGSGRFVATYSSTAAGARTISATVAGTALAGTAAVTVTAGAISAAQSLVASSLSSLEAGADTATITVTVRDANNNPISGVTVTFAATGSGNTVLNPVATTNASGVTSGRFTSTGAGPKTLTATAGGVTLSTQPVLTVRASRVSESLSTIAAAPASVVAGTTDSSAVTVTARDVYGNAIAAATVALTVSGGTANTVRQPPVTDASGVAVGYLRSTSAGAKAISARIRDTLITPTTSVTVTPAGVSAGASAVAVTNPTIAAGTGSTTITATVRDAFGNPIPGASVSFAVSGTGNSITQPTGTTNAAGVASTGFSSTVSGTKTVTVTAAGTTLTAQPTISVVADAVSAARSGLRTSATALTASSGGSSATLSVTARDANGNPVPSASVVFSTTDAGVTFVQPAGSTNASGEVTGSISATQSGSKTIRASLNGVTIDSSVVIAVAPAGASTATTTITAASTSITTDLGTTLTVQLRDQFGNALTSSTAPVTLATTLGTIGSVTPGANGTYTAAFSSAAVGTASITGTVNGAAIVDGESIVVSAGGASAATSTVTPAAAQFTAGGNTAITVQLRDQFGNPRSTGGNNVEITTTFGTISATTNNNNGTYTATLSSTAAGSARVSARLSSQAFSDTATVTITPAAVNAGTSSLTAAASSIVAGSAGTTITATVRDQFNNVVPNAAVVFTLSGSGSLTTLNTSTNASGVATTTLTSTTSGNVTVSATAAGTAITQQATVTVTAGAATQLQYLQQPTNATAGASITPAITVRALDANGNLVTTFTGTVVLAIEAGTGTAGALLTSGASLSVSAVNGVATFSNASINLAGTGYRLRATSTGLTFALSSTFSIAPAAATTLAFTTQPSATTAAGQAIAQQPAVTVRDAFGNTVTSYSTAVGLALSAGSTGTLSGTASVVPVNGVATFSGLSVNLAGPKTLTATSGGLASATSNGFTIVATAISDTASRLEVGSASITAGDAGTSVTATVRDRFGNPRSGVSVAFTASNGATLTPASASTDASGVATSTLTASAAGSTTVSARAADTLITQTRAVTVATAAPSALTSTIAAAPASITTDGSSTITVTLFDAFGNRINTGPATVAMSAVGGTVGAVTNVGDGRYTATFTSGTVGTATVSATINGTPMTNTAQVSVGVGAASPASTLITPSAASITTDGTATITVQLRDAAGNNLSTTAGSTVVLSSTLTTLSAPVAGPNGTFTATLTPVTTGTATITGTLNGVAITDNAVVTVGAGAPSATQSLVSVSPASVAAGVASTVTVTVRDAFSNAVPGATVTFTATGTGNTLTQPGAVTDAGGVATGSISSTAAGAKVITAVAGGVTLTTTPTLTVTAGSFAPGTSSLTVSGSTLTASSGATTVTVTATVRDANSNPISGATVTFAATGTGNNFAPATAVTDGSGVATSAFSSTVAAGKTLSASVGGTSITQTQAVTVIPAVVSASASTLVVDPTSIVAATGSASVTVTARDAFNNAISGAAVVLAASGSGNTVTQPTGSTNGSGVATGAVSSTAAGIKRVSATVAGVALADTVDLTVTAGAVSASATTVTVSPGSIVASSGATTATVTVTARDASGNPIPNATVALAVSGTGNTVGSVANTNASGVSTATVSSTVAETKTITATVGGVVISAQPTLTVTPAAISAAQSLVSVAPTSVAASVSSTVTVTARDAFNNAVPGATVTFTATGTGNTLTQPGAVTNASGVATGSISSTAAGAKVITAVAGGVTLTSTPTLTVTAGSFAPGNSLLTAGAASIAASSGSGGTTVTATVRDSNGNPISGAPVTFAATGTGNTFGAASGNTDVAGVYSTTFRSTVAEAKTISASVSGTSITPTAAVTVTPAAASATTTQITAAPTAITTDQTSTISVQARDAFGNALTASGGTVTLSSTIGGALAVTDNANGTYTATLSPATTGTATITGTIGGVAITDDASVVVTAGAGNVSTSSFTVDATQIVASAGTVTTAGTVTVRDAGNNPVSGVSVSFAATGQDNVFTPSSGTTNASGQLNVTFSSQRAQAKTLTATIAGVGAITQQPALTVVPAAASALTSTLSALSGTITADQTTTVTLQLIDAFGNALSSGSATVTLSASSGSLSAPVNQGNGTYTATYTPQATGSISIGGTIGGTAITNTTTITVSPGAAATLAFVQQPTNTTAGASISPAVTVRALDARGNVATGFGGTVAMALDGSPGTGTLAGTTSVAAASGVATFSSLSISLAGTGRTLTASSAGLTSSTSAPFSITPAAVSGGVSQFSAPASTRASTDAGMVLTATVRDAFDNPISGATVNFEIISGPGNLSVASATSAANGNATTTFTATATGSTQIRALVGAVVLGSAVTIETTAGAAAALAFTTQPSASSVAGAAFAQQPVVEVRDANGNRVTAFTGNVTMSLLSGSGSLLGSTTVAAVAGVASFAGLAVDSAGTGKLLQASISGPITATSTSFSITPGDAATLAFVSIPTSVANAATFGSDVVVVARDSQGNIATGFTAAVTIEVVGDATGLSGTLTRNAVTGQVTFDNLAYTGSAETITLRVTAPALPAATSAGITVTP